jgi:hypothetical protein
MRYIECSWKHNHPDEPVLLYSELDDARWELRKVEKFLDGGFGFADRKVSYRDTMLGLRPIPANADIVEMPEFELREITEQEFEAVWQAATATQ